MTSIPSQNLYLKNFNQIESPAISPQAYVANSATPVIKNLENDVYIPNDYVEEQYLPEQEDTSGGFKKTAISVSLALITIVSLALLGNKSSNKMADLGLKADKYLLKQSWYQNLEKAITNCKSKVKNFFLNNKNKMIKNTTNDVVETLAKRHSGPTVDLARGYGQGYTTIFSLTPVDILQTSLSKMESVKKGSALSSLEKLVGKTKAAEFYKKLCSEEGLIKDNKQFCSEITEAIAERFGAKEAGGKINKEKLLNIFIGLEKGNVDGVDLSEFTNITMNKQDNLIGGVMSSWWPVNFIDKVGSKIAKIFGKKWTPFCKGNLGDSLVKFNAVNGSLADTTLGSLIQKSITVPTESISNFVNDKSGLGVGLGLTVASLYGNVQDAPKNKKVATMADDFVGTIGSIAVTTPLAFGATYGLASMANLKGENVLTKCLKQVGKFFDFGHNRIGLNGEIINTAPKSKLLAWLKRASGHTLRFVLIMFVFSSIFDKPIRKCIHAIFGNPYEKGVKDIDNAKVSQVEHDGIVKVKHNPKTLERVYKTPLHR